MLRITVTGHLFLTAFLSTAKYQIVVKTILYNFLLYSIFCFTFQLTHCKENQSIQETKVETIVTAYSTLTVSILEHVKAAFKEHKFSKSAKQLK